MNIVHDACKGTYKEKLIKRNLSNCLHHIQVVTSGHRLSSLCMGVKKKKTITSATTLKNSNPGHNTDLPENCCLEN